MLPNKAIPEDFSRRVDLLHQFAGSATTRLPLPHIPEDVQGEAQNEEEDAEEEEEEEEEEDESTVQYNASRSASTTSSRIVSSSLSSSTSTYGSLVTLLDSIHVEIDTDDGGTKFVFNPNSSSSSSSSNNVTTTTTTNQSPTAALQQDVERLSPRLTSRLAPTDCLWIAPAAHAVEAKEESSTHSHSQSPRNKNSSDIDCCWPRSSLEKKKPVRRGSGNEQLPPPPPPRQRDPLRSSLEGKKPRRRPSSDGEIAIPTARVDTSCFRSSMEAKKPQRRHSGGNGKGNTNKKLGWHEISQLLRHEFGNDDDDDDLTGRRLNLRQALSIKQLDPAALQSLRQAASADRDAASL